SSDTSMGRASAPACWAASTSRRKSASSASVVISGYPRQRCRGLEGGAIGEGRGGAHATTLRAIGIEPGVEAAVDGAARGVLLRRGARREMVRVLVLRVSVVPAYPVPADGVRRGGADGIVPQREVLDR